jgi:anti-sigma B factor antagonist
VATMDELRIEREQRGAAIVVTLDGPVSVNTYEKLEAALEEGFRAGVYSVVVDMGNVRYVSSAGAGVFMNALSQCRENQGTIVLVNLTPGVAEIFDLLNLTNVIPLATTVDTALTMIK